MKPTDLQKKVIDSVKSIISTWENTNDILSPTHDIDIEQFLFADLSDYVSDERRMYLEEELKDLLNTIKKIGLYNG